MMHAVFILDVSLSERDGMARGILRQSGMGGASRPRRAGMVEGTGGMEERKNGSAGTPRPTRGCGEGGIVHGEEDGVKMEEIR